MKTKYILTCAILFFGFATHSQTLYLNTPGTIGTSTNNNVGIGAGASSPQLTLEVLGSGQIIRNTPAAGYSTLRLYNDQNNMFRALEIDYSGSQYGSSLVNAGPAGESGSITTTGGVPLTLGTNNTSRMMIKADGKIGINNITPGAWLDIRTGSQPQLFLSTSRTFPTSRNWGIGTNWNAEGDFSILESTSNGDAPVLTRMVIDVTGNVGIGTPAPADQLQIVKGNRKVGFNDAGAAFSSGGVVSMTRADGYKTTYLGVTQGDEMALYSGGGGTEMRLVSGNGSSQGFGFYLNMNQDVAFGTRSGLPQPAMKINYLGNVGIGTTTPDQKLTVDGTVRCEEVKVELIAGSGPDYVFEKNYDLLSLIKLEAYINQNKHLPEVPSAKEMESEGLNLKEMNLLLLRKVEELTLHLIEQSKTIAQLKEEHNAGADPSEKKLEELTRLLMAVKKENGQLKQQLSGIDKMKEEIEAIKEALNLRP